MPNLMIKIHSNRLYITCSIGVLIYSLEDPVNPVLAGHYDTPDASKDIAFAGDYLVVADGTDLGVDMLESEAEGDASRFVAVPGVSKQCWILRGMR